MLSIHVPNKEWGEEISIMHETLKGWWQKCIIADSCFGLMYCNVYSPSTYMYNAYWL